LKLDFAEWIQGGTMSIVDFWLNLKRSTKIDMIEVRKIRLKTLGLK
jgi:hypothetical protein